MYRFWSLNGKPKNFEEGISKGMFSLESNGYHVKSVAENKESGELEIMKSRQHPTVWMETMNYDLNPYLHNNYILNLRDNKFYYTPRKQIEGKLNYLQFFN